MSGILGWYLFSVSILNILSHFLLACKVPAEKSTKRLMGDSLLCDDSFSCGFQNFTFCCNLKFWLYYVSEKSSSDWVWDFFWYFCTWMSVSLFKTESFQLFFLSIDSLILLRLLKCLYCIPTRCLISLVSSLSHYFFLSFSFLLLWMSNFKWIVFKFREEFFLLIKSPVTECFRQALIPQL